MAVEKKKKTKTKKKKKKKKKNLKILNCFNLLLVKDEFTIIKRIRCYLDFTVSDKVKVLFRKKTFFSTGARNTKCRFQRRIKE